jgi:hypothetical protein
LYIPFVAIDRKPLKNPARGAEERVEGRREMADLAVANTIRDQIGGPAFVMMCAKNLVGDDRALTWKVGRNEKKVTHVRVTLEPTDTYKVEFIKVGRAPGFKVETLGTHEMIYADQLHPMIEAGTGMYLTL